MAAQTKAANGSTASVPRKVSNIVEDEWDEDADALLREME